MKQHYFRAQIDLGEKYKEQSKAQKGKLEDAMGPVAKYVNLNMVGYNLMKNDETGELMMKISGYSPDIIESDFLYQFFVHNLEKEFENIQVMEKTTGYGEINVEKPKEEVQERDEKEVPKKQEKSKSSEKEEKKK